MVIEVRYKVESLDDFARGIIKTENKICFVKNALPDEEVEVEITKTKKNYNEGKIRKIIKKSPKRVNPKCKYYDICGGCNLEHLSLEDENNYKVKKVEQILEKFAHNKIKVNKITSIEKYSYRNKITLRVKDGNIGLYEEKTNNFIEIDKCLLVENKINEVILKLKDIVKKEQNITKIMIRLGNYTNELMIKIDGKVKDETKFLNLADSIIINDKVLNKKEIAAVILGYKYYVAADSFFQVNKEIVEKMYSKIIDLVKISKSKKVLDLYCGVGTIGISVSKYVESVIGIEVVEQAILNADKNKQLNNITNIDFICGKVEEIITNKRFNCDTIIVDPPRSGINKKAISVLNESGAEAIIYVSCDPITLARDINLLSNYELKEIELFNMFPCTYHVECVSLLSLKTLEK